jgi:hypothetical protein
LDGLVDVIEWDIKNHEGKTIESFRGCIGSADELPKVQRYNSVCPHPLTTNEIANCFAGLNEWDVNKWKVVLNSQRKWIADCRARKGTRGKGGVESTWLPVEIAKHLVRTNDVKPKFFTRIFKSQEPLKQWLEAWLPNDPEAA